MSCSFNVRIRYDDAEKKRIAVSVGHSIFNPGCKVNAGRLLSSFEGGGHRGAASCRFDAGKAERYLPQIIDALVANKAIEP